MKEAEVVNYLHEPDDDKIRDERAAQSMAEKRPIEVAAVRNAGAR